MKKFYIFDMDGTLASSMSFWRKECAAGGYNDIEDWESIFQRMKKHYANEIEIKEGAVDFLKNASSRGIKMCIASATRRDIAEPFLEKTGIMEFMEFYIDCIEIGAYKERPDIFLQSAERFGAEASECVVFEDSPHAAATAKSAGFYVVGVYDPVTVNDGDIKPYVDDYVEDWRDYSFKS